MIDEPGASLPPSVVGHRGARARLPENSLEGFAWAAARGVRTVECDVRLTRDQVLVCCHDATPARLGGPRVRVSRMTADEVAGVALRSGARIPALADVLDRIRGRTGIIVEVKDDPVRAPGAATAAEVLADLLRRRHAAGHGDEIRAVSSFDPATVASFARLSPEYGHRAALLTRPSVPVARAMALARSLGVDQMHPHYLALLREPGFVARARATGIDVGTWTVNRPSLAARLLRLGVSFVITDDPERIAAVAAAHEQTS